MFKKRNNIIKLFVLALGVLLLTGCGKARTDAQNTYKLPLGDSGYYSEIDFATEKYDGHKNEEGKVDGILKYDFVNPGKDYKVVISVRAMEEKFAGKQIEMVAGYYLDGEFKELADKTKISLTSDGFLSHEHNFSVPLDLKEKVVIKLIFGTSVDVDSFKEANPDATNKEIRAIEKKYRGMTNIKISSLSIINSLDEANSILVEKTTNGITVPKTNNDLVYFNTASVSYEAETLTLSLNYKGGVWQWIIKQLGRLLYWMCGILGDHYWIALLLFTLLLRSAAWPIYAKTNSYTSNMSAIQPEIEKLNKKYEGRTDQNSKMKQQMEMKALMKKNKVSLWGCLLPFAQMPIFIAVYQVVQRFPLTPMYSGVNYNFLWTTFASNYGNTTGDVVLAILVGLTMIGSQLLSTYFQKRAQKRRQNFYTAKAQQSNKSMLIMMAVMTVMMVVFAWNSAGIAFYWIIGNLYQIFQTAISKIQEEKKHHKKQLMSGRPEGR